MFQSVSFRFSTTKTALRASGFFRDYPPLKRLPNSLAMVCCGWFRSGKEVEGNRKKMTLFMTRLKYFILRSITSKPQLCHHQIRDFHRKIAFHAHFTDFLNLFAQLGCAKRNVRPNLFCNPFLPSEGWVFPAALAGGEPAICDPFSVAKYPIFSASAFLTFLVNQAPPGPVSLPPEYLIQ